MVNALFTQVADDLMTDYSSDLELETLPLEERLDVVKDLLHGEGFTMDWERKEDESLQPKDQGETLSKTIPLRRASLPFERLRRAV